MRKKWFENLFFCNQHDLICVFAMFCIDQFEEIYLLFLINCHNRKIKSLFRNRLFHDFKYRYTFFDFDCFDWINEIVFLLFHEKENIVVIIFNSFNLFQVSFLLQFIANDEHHRLISNFDVVVFNFDSQFVKITARFHKIHDDVIDRISVLSISFDKIAGNVFS